MNQTKHSISLLYFNKGRPCKSCQFQPQPRYKDEIIAHICYKPIDDDEALRCVLEVHPDINALYEQRTNT